jgi:hypothetical protein
MSAVLSSLSHFKSSLKCLGAGVDTPGACNNGANAVDSIGSPQEEPEIESENEANSDKPTPAEQLILDVLDRCYYFLAAEELSHQLTVVDIIAAGFRRISANRFPCHVHLADYFCLSVLSQSNPVACPAQELAIHHEPHQANERFIYPDL